MLNLGVNQYTSCHMKEQNIDCTKIAFSQSVLKIGTSEWEQKINKIHAHFLEHFWGKLLQFWSCDVIKLGFY